MSFSADVIALSAAVYLRLGEASGATMNDSSGNGRNGTHTGVTLGATGSVSGDSNTAATYAGTSGSHSDVAYGSWMNPATQAVSFMAAVKFTATGAGPFMFFSRDGGSNSAESMYYASKKLAFAVRTTSGTGAAVSPLDYNDGAFHLVIGTWDGSTIRLYVDGSLVASTAWGGTLSTATHNLQVGGRGANFAAATVDECATFPGVQLSAGQITALYNSWAGLNTGISLSAAIPATTGAFTVPVPFDPVGSWSWWTRPRAVAVNGKIYVGSTSKTSPTDGIIVDEYDATTTAHLARYTIASGVTFDDHNNPGLDIRPGEPPLVAWTRHAADDNISFAYGTQDIEAGFAVGSEVQVDFLGDTTYTALHRSGADLYLVSRSTSTQWSVAKSTDDGATWTEHRVLSFTVQVYMASVLADDGRLRLAASAHPREATGQSIYYAELDLATGTLYERDGTTVIGTWGSTGVSMSLWDEAAAPSSGYKTWVYDVSAGPVREIVWSQMDTDDLPNAALTSYRYTTDVSGSWASQLIVAAGAAFGSPATADSGGSYLGGVQFAQPGTVVLSREASGTWYVEYRRTTDGGATWSTDLIASSTVLRLVRPWKVEARDGTPADFVVINEIKAPFTSYLNHLGRVRLYAAPSLVGPTVTLAGTIPAVTGAFTVVSTSADVTLDGVVPAVTGAFSVTVTTPTLTVTLDGTVPAVTGAASLTAVDSSDWADAVRALGADVLWWARLNDGAGAAVLTDASGNDHHGSYAGLWTVQPAVVGDGKSVTFEQSTIGTSGRATVPVAGWLDAANGPDEFTLVVWGVRNPTGDAGYLFSKPSGPAPLSVSLGQDVSLTLNAGGIGYNIPTEHVVPGGRHMIVMRFKEGANGLSYLRDGVQIGAGFTIPTGDTPDWTNDALRLGDPNFPTDNPVDEAFLVGRALSDAEVLALYLAAGQDMSLAGTIARPTLTASITVNPRITLAGVQQNVQGSFMLTREETVTLAGTIPATTGTFALGGSYQMSLDSVVPAVTGVFDLTVPPQTETDNRASGRTRDGIAYGFYDPPVTAPPGTPGRLVKYSAMAYDAATVDTADGAARAVLSNVRVIEEDRAWYRIVVGGVDVTYWRGAHTPRPSYSYIEPLLYGPGSLSLPQVVLPYEVPGQGALAFLDTGSPVRVQAVDPDTGLVTGPDLWRGLIVKHNLDGRSFSVELGGEAAGRAGMRDFPQPVFRRRNDLGWWAYAAVRDLGLPFKPYGGPDTGLVSFNWGGTNYLDYLQEVCSRAVARSGAQWTIMPGAGGNYRLSQKDLTTRHCTIYLDDSLAVASLTRDMAEEPNEVYATGSTVTGNRVNFAVYPGLVQGPPAPYPFNDDSPFGEGTTDADTDSGDGVTVMLWKLAQMGYLDEDDRDGTYNAAVTKAVRHLQEDAAEGPTFVNGIMDPDTWDALYDLTATGATLAWSHIEPAAQWRSTRKYRRSAAGSVMALNPGYDPKVPRVSTTIDVGPGWRNRNQIQDFADGELTPEGEHHYVGTITLNSRGIILGDHNPGDPLTEADVVSSDKIRAGWNAWLPLFDGGTLVHVSAVTFDESGTPTLTVDTRGRDARKVWEVIRRNRESRINPARAWLAQRRSSGLTKDTVTEFDGSVGGKVAAGTNLTGGAWTVVEVVAGQEGTIRTLRLLTDPPTEFAVGVFGESIEPARLAAVVGNPLTQAGTKRWNSPEIQDQLDDDVLLYVAGDHDNPCGYWPRTKQIKNTTDGGVTGNDNPDNEDDTETDENEDAETTRHNPLNGRWRDDAGFPFRTFSAPVLYVAIYARHNTVLKPGRVLWPVNDPGS